MCSRSVFLLKDINRESVIKSAGGILDIISFGFLLNQSLGGGGQDSDADLEVRLLIL